MSSLVYIQFSLDWLLPVGVYPLFCGCLRLHLSVRLSSVVSSASAPLATCGSAPLAEPIYFGVFDKIEVTHDDIRFIIFDGLQ